MWGELAPPTAPQERLCHVGASADPRSWEGRVVRSVDHRRTTMAGKKLAEAAAKIDRTRLYHPAEALELARETNPTKFDATVEVAFRLGVDPRRADQMVRGTVSLPNGTGKTVRVAVFAEGEAARLAEEAGADVVGGRDLVERVQGGFLDFDAAVAVPEMMGQVGRLGRILGPRGLMPNPRAGTVTPDVA